MLASKSAGYTSLNSWQLSLLHSTLRAPSISLDRILECNGNYYKIIKGWGESLTTEKTSTVQCHHSRTPTYTRPTNIMSGITEGCPLAHVRSPAQRLVSSPPSRLIPLRSQTSGIEIPKIGRAGGAGRNPIFAIIVGIHTCCRIVGQPLISYYNLSTFGWLGSWMIKI